MNSDRMDRTKPNYLEKINEKLEEIDKKNELHTLINPINKALHNENFKFNRDKGRELSNLIDSDRLNEGVENTYTLNGLYEELSEKEDVSSIKEKFIEQFPPKLGLSLKDCWNILIFHILKSGEKDIEEIINELSKLNLFKPLYIGGLSPRDVLDKYLSESSSLFEFINNKWSIKERSKLSYEPSQSKLNLLDYELFTIPENLKTPFKNLIYDGIHLEQSDLQFSSDEKLFDNQEIYNLDDFNDPIGNHENDVYIDTIINNLKLNNFKNWGFIWLEASGFSLYTEDLEELKNQKFLGLIEFFPSIYHKNQDATEKRKSSKFKNQNFKLVSAFPVEELYDFKKYSKNKGVFKFDDGDLNDYLNRWINNRREEKVLEKYKDTSSINIKTVDIERVKKDKEELQLHAEQRDYNYEYENLVKRAKIKLYKERYKDIVVHWYYFHSHSQIKKDINQLKVKPQILFSGPPGTGKSWIAQKIGEYFLKNNYRNNKIINRDNNWWTNLSYISDYHSNNPKNSKIQNSEYLKKVQFFPSLSYQDFVQGIRPNIRNEKLKGTTTKVMNEEGKSSQETSSLSYKRNDGVYYTISKKASKNPMYNYVLVLEEINRGNTLDILGNLFYLFDYRDTSFESLIDKTRIQMPSNLFIVATINPGEGLINLGSAFYRRFINRRLNITDYEYGYLDLYFQLIKNAFPTVSKALVRIIKILNHILSSKLGENTIEIPIIGHTFFLGSQFKIYSKDKKKTKESLERVFEQSIFPMLKQMEPSLNKNIGKGKEVRENLKDIINNVKKILNEKEIINVLAAPSEYSLEESYEEIKDFIENNKEENE